MEDLIGKLVMNRRSHARGRIVSISGNKIIVEYSDEEFAAYQFPSALSDTLVLQDRELQQIWSDSSNEDTFSSFKNLYRNAIKKEIAYLQFTGGKKYRVMDGIRMPSVKNQYIYSFDTDTELHFPDGTAIRISWGEERLWANVISCEEYTLIFQVSESLGESIESLEFTAEPWQLLEGLIERIDALDAMKSPIAYEVACRGRYQIDERSSVAVGQNRAIDHAFSDPVTFIWGPPGTGKTTTLSRIASECMNKGKRVLMLSYSNVSVDGALLRVAETSDMPDGSVVRYGYPRRKELLESHTLTSYAFVLHQRPQLAEEYRCLIEEKKHTNSRSERRIQINKELSKIRTLLHDYEVQLIQNAAFVATTVSKAVVDPAVYSQKFDVVIFDEASMAYVPQIVFAAGLAKESFICLGDFRQLPAIVQNPDDSVLVKDIFDYTDITMAVENGHGHNWLVMLNMQYRMHPQIAEFASKNMYEGLLRSADVIFEQRQRIANEGPLSGEAMSLIDLSNTYSVCIKTMDNSHINIMSAMISVKIAEILNSSFGIGIITPYSAQARLLLAMIRDMQERNPDFGSITCATVHQFQGSEKPVIIYDSVDCFRMPYAGSLLTSKKNNTADRLFNVALTRTQGKFIMVSNRDFYIRKNTSKDLIFRKMLDYLKNYDDVLIGDDILLSLGTTEEEFPEMFLGERDEIDSWNRFIDDISNAENEIFIDVPGIIDDDEVALEELGDALLQAEEREVKVYVRTEEDVSVPSCLLPYTHIHGFVTMPITVIDRKVVWYGEPLCAASFYSEGEILPTETFPCLRFEGKHTARMIKALLEIPTF